jgi:GDP-4-dehydro-6-deoxy-D-mannose reductase
LIVGSAEQYGAIKQESLPLTEDYRCVPTNPYAASKTAQEEASKVFIRAYGIDVVFVRAFNHIGPYQSPIFVVSDFAKQIAEIEKGKREPIIRVGNLEAKRDFTDVRDIVRGYVMIIKRGKTGEVYNVGSGESMAINKILEILIHLSSNPIQVLIDPEKIRPVEILELKASIDKIRIEVGWEPNIDINKSLEDVLNFWRLNC